MADFGNNDPVAAGFGQNDAVAPQGLAANAADFVKSIPEGIARGLRQYGAGHQQEAEFFNQPFTGGSVPSGPEIPTGLPLPQGKAGQYGLSVGEAVGNPMSWFGPGGSILKGVGAVLSGLGGQAGEDIGGTPGRIAGSILGGATAAKAAGAKAAEAATPTKAELRTSYKGHYDAANASGLEASPDLLRAYGYHTDQQLGRFDPDLPAVKYVRQMRDHEGGGIVTAANLDTVRQRLGEYARETSEGKPTSNAAAASIALENFNKVLDNIPSRAVTAGDAAEYIRQTRLGNQDYMAAQQLRDAQKKINAAEVDTGRGFATKIDNQLKAKFAPILKNESQQRGLSDEQIAAVQKLNDASPIAKQLGRFSPFSPVGLALHTMMAPIHGLTMGSLAVPQLIFAGTAHAGRLMAERAAKKQAQTIADLAAQRSALYQQRQSMVPNVDTSGNQAQLIRGLLSGMH